METKIYNSQAEIDTSKLRAWVEIDLSKFKHNIEVIKELLYDDVQIVGVVKANAYGHGDVVVAKYFESLGIKYFAVACIEEAIKLREGGIKGDIIILGWTPSCQKDDLIKYDLCQTLVSEEYAEELNKLLNTSCATEINSVSSFFFKSFIIAFISIFDIILGILSVN